MLYDPKWQTWPESETQEPWRKLLMDAADYIEKYGWRRSSLGRAGESVCVRGAFGAVSRGNTLRWTHAEGRREAESKLREELKLTNVKDILHWNDNIAKDKDEVVSTLRKVAAKE